AALAAGAVGVVVAVTLLRSVPGPTSPAASAPAPPAIGAPAARAIMGGRIATPNDPGFPSPPPDAVVLAREAGSRALALAVKPGLVRVSVVGLSGTGESGLRVALRFGRRHHRRQALGPELADGAVAAVVPEPSGAPAPAVLAGGDGRASPRRVAARLACLVLRPRDAGVVRGLDRPRQWAHARARHDR